MQCGGAAPAIMQNGQGIIYMEESERYCRKCELAKQYGGGLEEYLLRYLAQLTPEEQAKM